MQLKNPVSSLHCAIKDLITKYGGVKMYLNIYVAENIGNVQSHLSLAERFQANGWTYEQHSNLR